MVVQTNEETPILISVEATARLLGVSRGMAYQMAQRGELPVVRFGKAVRVHRGRLNEWLERQAR